MLRTFRTNDVQSGHLVAIEVDPDGHPAGTVEISTSEPNSSPIYLSPEDRAAIAAFLAEG